MANTRHLTTQVEDHVRAALAERYGIHFVKRYLPLASGGRHELTPVAENGRIVASVKKRLRLDRRREQAVGQDREREVSNPRAAVILGAGWSVPAGDSRLLPVSPGRAAP